jgi:hypothetical protein
VLGFDLESEKWNDRIKGPRSGEELEDCKCLVGLNDALCMTQWTSSTELCLIWALTDSTKGTWVKLYTIPMDPTFDTVNPLMVMPDGRKLLFYTCNWDDDSSSLQVYDPRSGTCTQLTQFEENISGTSGICALHLGCFVSPKNLPVSAPTLFSQLVSCQWLRRLNPFSLLYK